VAPRPADRVLEVGCGHGVLVSLLADRLDTGSVLALDRSATMVAAATRRNRAAVEAGRVALVTAPLVDADLADLEFDVVVSFDVRALWTPPAAEWDVVARVLAPAGRVVVAFSLMTGEVPAAVDEGLRRVAGERGFEVAGVHRGATLPFPSAAYELRSRSAARPGADPAG
jgi:ubiquinone/menaquinone biosynthesis C-methylase UbiE